MDFEYYTEKTAELAVYPEDYERDYVIHGLVDEIGELARTVKTVPDINSPISPSRMGNVHVQQICKEMGDAMWYLSRLCDHFDFDISTDLNKNLQIDTADSDEGERQVELAFMAAAEINGHQKKSVRDDADKVDEIRVNVREIVKALRKAAHHLGVHDLDVVMERNLDKLFDRKERNVLHGDGDNR